MPTRVVTGGVGTIPGASMSERRDWAKEHLDELRGLLMREPHGHGAMSGAILQPPTREDADWGVLYIETTGFLPMCGHGTMGVCTVLVETGLVAVTEPVTELRLDTPAGLVRASVMVADGQAKEVRLTNVDAFVLSQGESVEVPGVGAVSYDMVYGGNFYPLVDAASIGVALRRENKARLSEIGAQLVAVINAEKPPVHPDNESIRGIHHVEFTEPETRDEEDRLTGLSAVYSHPDYFDRSPCGTGTSARMALLHARGQLALGEQFVSRSMLGTRFIGELAEPAGGGPAGAVSPSIRGRAWITAFSQHVLDPDDPFPSGFTF